MFLSPVLYPIAALPEIYRPWMHLNPLTYVIEESRSVLLMGNVPDWEHLAVAIAVAAAMAATGFWLFQKTRKGFADVL